MNRRLLSIFSFFIVFFAALGNPAHAQEAGSFAAALFAKANRFYQQGDYEQARQAYESIAGQNVISGNLYYNLGNTYFKLGRLGKAIVNYERAKRRIPNDSDLKANLAFARESRKNPILPRKHFWLVRMLKRFAAYFTLDALTLITVFLYWALIIFASIGVVFGKARSALRGFIIGLWIMVCIVGSAGVIKFIEEQVQRYAIVVVLDVDSKFAPSSNAVIHFKLYEGTRVNVLDSDGAWLRIKTPDGKIGWVQGEALEII